MSERPGTARLDGGSEADLARAAELLTQGGLVAFPTETVYGLGARADRSEAVRAIFAAKGRPSTNPVIVHVASREAAAEIGEWNEAAEALARAFWPGPLTLVVRAKSARIAFEVTAGGATVGLRVPAHPVALALLRAVALPIAAPSANRSSAISPTTAEHVLKSLDGLIDAILDGGASSKGIESTIVDVSRTPAVLLRPGALSLVTLRAIALVRDDGHRLEDPNAIARAPGGLSRHYAPRARVVVVAAREVAEEVAARRARGERVASLERASETAALPPNEALPADPEGFAAELYAALHRLDDAGVETIVIAETPDEPAWHAVRDRIRRAGS